MTLGFLNPMCYITDRDKNNCRLGLQLFFLISETLLFPLRLILKYAHNITGMN